MACPTGPRFRNGKPANLNEKYTFTPRDPENMDPYGAQNHPLPNREEEGTDVTEMDDSLRDGYFDEVHPSYPPYPLIPLLCMY